MSPVRITLDGRSLEAQSGQYILAAARAAGIDIPTLCHLEKCGPLTSCLVCLVKIRSNGGGRLVPACGTRVQEGMVIESETPEVHEARRTALELLLSDHVGDCLSPCHRICPLHLNIPLMLRQVQEGSLSGAAVTVTEALPLPAVTGRLCHRPCENGCRRGTHDQPAAIREVERQVADHDLHCGAPHRPSRRLPTGKSVAIMGAGPTGLAAAYSLQRDGHQCTVMDRQAAPGGSLRAEALAASLPREILEADIGRLRELGVKFVAHLELGRNCALEQLLDEHHAVLLALGEIAAKEVTALGLTPSASGVQVDPATGATGLPGVFAAGSAVKPIRQVVRALAEGRAAALSVSGFLRGQAPRPARKAFSSVMGRLDAAELQLFLHGHSAAPRLAPAGGLLRGFTPGEASAESGRCLHCDCRAAGNCRLQEYAERYGAEPNRFPAQRRAFEQHLQHGEIVFEPGKCILCGICVKLAEMAQEPLGLTFVGRGFEVRLRAPLDRTIAEGLQKVGAECVEQCPTGALVFKDEWLASQARRAGGGGGCAGCGGQTAG